jgi:hypothetical protein
MNTLLKNLVVGTLFAVSSSAHSAVIASMPNQAGGKIVLTDEACVHKGRNFPNLYKSYFYTNSGLSGDGCWTIEDGSETITVIWIDTGDTKRYPIVNFDIRRK